MSVLVLGPRRGAQRRGVMLASLTILAAVLAQPGISAAQEQSKDAPPLPAVEATPAAPPATAAPATTTPPAEEKLSEAQLDQLVAPIALYPDPLLAQILTASTYPLEVEMAARWSKANPNIKNNKDIENAMQRQNWDPSVKALAVVPQVLQMMSTKLDWTQQLGDAYLAQPDDITLAIQRLRQKAADAGNLMTTKEQKVTRVDGPPPDVAPGPGRVVAPRREYIAIEPVDPDVIYVPVYDPVVVYGAWPYPAFTPWYWYPPGFVAVGIFAFSAPCFVGPALWARWNWPGHRIGVHIHNYNAFNRTRLPATPANAHWNHNPLHRGNIAYKNAALQQQFGRPGINGNPVGNNHNALRSNVPGTLPAARSNLPGTPPAARGNLPGTPPSARSNLPGTPGQGVQPGTLPSARQGITGNVNPGANVRGNANLNPIGTQPGRVTPNPNVNPNIGRSVGTPSVGTPRAPAVARSVAPPSMGRSVGAPAMARPAMNAGAMRAMPAPTMRAMPAPAMRAAGPAPARAAAPAGAMGGRR